MSIPTIDQIRKAPKVLLHDHLDGGLRPATVVDLAAEQGYDRLPTTDPQELAAWFVAAAPRRALGRDSWVLEAIPKPRVGRPACRSSPPRCAMNRLIHGGIAVAVYFASLWSLRNVVRAIWPYGPPAGVRRLRWLIAVGVGLVLVLLLAALAPSDWMNSMIICAFCAATGQALGEPVGRWPPMVL